MGKGSYLTIVIAVVLFSAFTIKIRSIDLFQSLSLLQENEAEDPVADFIFDQDGDCADQSIKFTNTSTGDNLTFEWNFGDGSTSTQKDPEHVFSTAIGGGERTFIIRLIVTSTIEVDEIETQAKDTIEKEITIKEIPSMNVTSDAGNTTFDELPYFIVCDDKSSEFSFFNAPAANENNVLYEIEWGDGSPGFSGQNWTELKHTYQIGIYTLKYSVTSANGCKITKEYGVFVGANPAVGLGNPGNTNVCVGSALTFPITGTENNPAGTRYIVTFSDDPANPQVFDHPAPATVTHIFQSGSCGNESAGFNNSFSVTIRAENPCASSAATVVPIYVTEIPEPIIQLPEDPVCIDQIISILNITDVGTEVSTNGQCLDPKYVWEITPNTGWELAGGSLGTINNPDLPNTWVSGSQIINPRFTEPGTYTIKLKTGNRCGIEEREETICVIPQPVSSFDLDNPEVCGPGIIKATNTTNILGLCENERYTWSVSYSPGACGTVSDWDFLVGFDQNSINPEFEFNNPGIYTISLTAFSSCGSVSSSQTINISAPPIVSIANIQDVCGPSTISPLASVTACDDSDLSYKWTFEGGVPNSSVEEIPGEVQFETPGLKTVTLEVTSSCGTTIQSRTFTVNPLPQVDAGEDVEICNGESTILEGNVNPEGDYTYLWTSDNFSPITGSTTLSPSVSPSQTTTYTLRARNTVTGCEEFDQVTVTVIPAPIVVFDIPNQEICSGETSSLVNITSEPVGEIISWTVNGTGIIGLDLTEGENQIPSFTLMNTTGAPIDIVFTAEITSANFGDCNFSPSLYTIKVNPEPVYEDSNLDVCNEETFSFVPEGFLPGTSFTWTSNEVSGLVGNTSSNERQNSLTQTLRNETNETLTIIYTITPFLGNCIGSPFELEVTVQPSPSISFSLPEQTLCTGDSSQEIIISSDVTDAQFSWTANPNGAEGVTLSGTGNSIPVQTITNPTNTPILVEYLVTATTSTGNSCSGNPKVYAIIVNPTITLNSSISDYSGFQISCFGANDGFIQLNPQGGSGNFIFKWTGPNRFISDQRDLENLVPGEYSVLIEDEFGCSLEESFTIREPSSLNASLISSRDIFCSGESTGQISIEVVGGVSNLPYIFSWTRNGVPINLNSQNLSDVPAGIYEVNIQDQNGCSILLGPIELAEPDEPLVIDFVKTDISCYDANDGFISLNIEGGVPPFQIRWSNNSTRSELDNLGPGVYTVQVSDQAGCIKVQTVVIEDAPLFRIEPEVRQISCFGENDGYIKLNFEGGVGQPEILWENGEDRDELFNLGPGTYSVLIKDETDCEIRSEFNIVEPAQLLMEPIILDALDCDNPQSGAIRLGISGGKPPYTIQWNNGQTAADLENIPSGQYTVQVTDISGCRINGVFEVKRPDPLKIIAFRRTNVVCEPRLIVEEIQISVSGGVAPYEINWSGGEVMQNGLLMRTPDPGLYSVEVIDGNGCITSESFEIVNPEVILDVEIESIAFDQYNSYLVNYEIQFWNRSFGQIKDYFWDFGDGNFSFEENPKHTFKEEGEYEITLSVTDIYGCITQIKKTVKVFDYFLVMPNAFTPNGDGVNDYFFPRFINIESLEFWVLNKWGETIYYTNDLGENGWDGTVNGKEVPAGNYVYRLTFKTLDGRKQDQTDVFLLLK